MLSFFQSALEKLQPWVVERRLYRCVERGALESSSPPSFLLVTGKPGRYNPDGVHCVYWGEDPEQSLLEYRRYMESIGLDPDSSPFTTYAAEAKLAVLDLGDPGILGELDLTEADLHTGWRTSRAPTSTQLLGKALARQKRFTAIRFPSDAAFQKGLRAFNWVAYRDSIQSPLFLKVLSGGGIPGQGWP